MTSYAIIARKANELLALANITSPPTDLKQITSLLDLHVEYQPFTSENEEEISGCILKSDDKYIIGINSSHHLNRQRFTIAHEIGHYILHRSTIEKEVHLDRSYRSSQGTHRIEIEANNFASHLLMPEKFIMRECNEKEIVQLDLEDDESEINDLADKFQVSTQAMTIRLVGLSVLPKI